MPQPLRPLPEIGHQGHFTRRTARAHGVTDGRLAGPDLERISRGLYRRTDEPQHAWSRWGLPEPAHGLDAASLAALMAVSGCVLSHHTAAHLYGVPLPRRLARDPDIQATALRPQRRTKRTELRCHGRALPPQDITEWNGIRVVTPERLWLDLASLYRPDELDELIAAGDHLVTPPWSRGGRDASLSSLDRLQQRTQGAGRLHGVRLARAALPWVRVGSDSRVETLLRRALVRAGLPEPELQVSPAPGAPFTADLAYREWRIALQYDGAHHRSPEQQARDARRDAWFQQHGWRVIRVTSEDLRTGFRRVIELIRTWAQLPAH